MRSCFPSVFKSSATLAVLVASLSTLLTGCETTSRVARDAYYILPFTGPKSIPGETPILKNAATASTKGVPIDKGRLALTMTLTPVPVSLSEQRQIDIRLRLKNVSNRFVQLEFPTSQRIEILVRDEKSHLVTQWSEDRAFDPGISYVAINPGEHIEYATTISTRDLKAGKHYRVFGFFPNYEALRTEKTITPVP